MSAVVGVPDKAAANGGAICSFFSFFDNYAALMQKGNHL